MNRLILGGALGGLVVFAWGFISWMVLPWHDAVQLKFADEAAVAAVLKANAPQHGLYVLPNPGQNPDMSMDDGMELMKAGPLVFASVRPGPRDFSLPGQMLGSLIIQSIAAFLATALVLAAGPLGYWGRVLFAVMLGAFAGVVAALPAWWWWEFPTNHTLVTFLDLVIGWFLAGLVIARIARPADRSA